MRKIIVDDPFAPGELKPVPIKAYARENAGVVSTNRRRGIERYPAVSMKVNFHPAVRITLPDDVIAAEVVLLAGQKAGDVARGNPDGTEHHCHRRSEVFAVAGAANKQKIGDRVGDLRASTLKGLGVMRGETAT